MHARQPTCELSSGCTALCHVFLAWSSAQHAEDTVRAQVLDREFAACECPHVSAPGVTVTGIRRGSMFGCKHGWVGSSHAHAAGSLGLGFNPKGLTLTM
eukprot:364555-Chlamydomonas_euryale.AAC.18